MASLWLISGCGIRSREAERPIPDDHRATPGAVAYNLHTERQYSISETRQTKKRKKKKRKDSPLKIDYPLVSVACLWPWFSGQCGVRRRLPMPNRRQSQLLGVHADSILRIACIDRSATYISSHCIQGCDLFRRDINVAYYLQVQVDSPSQSRWPLQPWKCLAHPLWLPWQYLFGSLCHRSISDGLPESRMCTGLVVQKALL